MRSCERQCKEVGNSEDAMMKMLKMWLKWWLKGGQGGQRH